MVEENSLFLNRVEENKQKKTTKKRK